MKKIFLILLFVCSFVFSYAQNDSTQVRYQPRNADVVYYHPTIYQDASENYFEFGLGSFIPTDDSNSFFQFDIEAGKYFNKYFGLGLNAKFGNESEYHDRLGYIGPKFRFRVNYSPRNDFDLDLHAGLGYGWLDYNLYGYDYDIIYKTINYVVPNVGMTGYINIGRTVSLGIEPAYFWYISTNKDESENVGVWNIMGKLKFRF